MNAEDTLSGRNFRVCREFWPYFTKVSMVIENLKLGKRESSAGEIMHNLKNATVPLALN